MSACTLYSFHYSSDHRNLVHEVYEIHSFVVWRFTVLYQLLGPCYVVIWRLQMRKRRK